MGSPRDRHGEDTRVVDLHAELLEARLAHEVVDLALGTPPHDPRATLPVHEHARDHLPDAVAAALTVPLATDWRRVTFAADAYWRGETHRLCDRPAGLIRLIDELIDLGVEQIVLVSAAPETPGPHALASPRLDGRGRLGEYLQSAEAAVVRDATTTTGGVRIFTVRPAHNPIGPFDFSGGYDDRSHRRQGLAELISRGYEDAYHQFIEPVVGASGDEVKFQTSDFRSLSPKSNLKSEV